jgi:hypothetical protein
MYAYTYVKLCSLNKEFAAVTEITSIQETALRPQKIKKKKKEKRTLML